ncbi:MAG: hypothetical protein V1934_07680 [Methanobacteriota archaeon]
MEIEDPRLHETAAMWKSSQHQINLGAAGLMALLLTMGVIIGLAFSDAPFPIYTIPLAVIMVFGIPVAIYVAYTNFDQKDHWTLALPFNRTLYDLLEAAVEEKFAHGGYKYQAVGYSGLSVARASAGGSRPAKAYAFYPGDGSRMEVRFALLAIRGKNHTTYLFPMEIRNVRMKNIDHARKIQADLMEVLMRVDFLSYKEAH